MRVCSTLNLLISEVNRFGILAGTGFWTILSEGCANGLGAEFGAGAGAGAGTGAGICAVMGAGAGAGICAGESVGGGAIWRMFANQLGSIAATGISTGAGAGIGISTIHPSGFSEREEPRKGAFSGGIPEGGMKARFGCSMTGGVSEKFLFGSGKSHQKVLLWLSGFGVIEVLAPNKSPIKKANSCCGF